MKILHLNLMKKWFYEILEGKKKIEYRKIKPYWTKRLFNPEGIARRYDCIVFRNGYSRNAPEMKVEYLGVRKKGKYEIILGNILESKNIEK